jgi:HD-GYP domain-containing protein (c-di-GMP phosphodiesterase class II)
MQKHEDKAVARLSEIVALECGVHHVTAKRIRAAAALHDVGKLKIPGSILNKPGKLTPQEFEVMKTHTALGADMLSSLQGDLGVMAKNICLYHHEHHSGAGYWGKYTDELPAYVPIVSICDVFIALISERVYKRCWPPHEALDYIQSQAGTRFSYELEYIFRAVINNDSRIPAILEQYGIIYQ